jgi:glycyl-tRNA synthetase beta chain
MEAVLRPATEGSRDLPDLMAKMKALQGLTTRPEFDPLIVGFKRAHRLVEKEKWSQEQIDASLFQDASEEALQAALQDADRTIHEALGRHQYGAALDALVGLKPAIDAFFVGVMVNAEEPALRANRLSLLYAVDRLFLSFADFSHIVVAGT